ncbi:hypothetical protein [Streptomyces sp. Y1]|uniref:N-acetyltransferase domain-containing protein n=1 Tax=Streptomyces sp. Y1 TaxID=3238634 RepID=A0AB39TX22_9ACTN
MEALHDWLARRGVDTGMIWELPRWNAALPPDGDGRPGRRGGRAGAAGGAWAAAHEELVERTLGPCVRKVAGVPGGVARLLLLVLEEVEQAWQVSYTFDRLLGTLHGAERCLAAVHAPCSPDDLAARQAVRALMWSLDAQIRSEEAMTSGLLDVRADRADDAALWARRAVRLMRGVSPRFCLTHGDVAREVVRLGRLYDGYQRTMAMATRALAAFYACGAPLDDAVEALRRAEGDGAIAGDEGSVSELRALRYSLLELQERARQRWLRVGHGKLVYLYPFAVRGVEPADLVEAVGQEEAPRWELAGTRPVRAHGSLELDDVWKSHDSLERRYDGALVVMPDAVVRAPDGRALARLGVQVRLSLLGNHYVRFEADLTDVSAVKLFAMLFWAGPEAGALDIAFDGTDPKADGGGGGGGDGGGSRARWPRLSDLAMALAQDSVPTRPGAARAVVCRPGLYQVVMEVTAAYTVVGPAGEKRSEILTGGQFAEAVGARILTSPAPSLMGSMAEWIRYAEATPASPDITGTTGEWILRTCNTTLLVSLGLPAFVRDTWGSILEFASSLDGLLEGWSTDLAKHHRDAKAREDEADALGDKASSHALRRLSDQLDQEKLKLDRLAVDVHAKSALFQSPSLLASPLAAQRLRVLLEASGYQRKADELSRSIAEVTQEQLTGAIEKLARERKESEKDEREAMQRRQRVKVDTLLAVIAGMSIAGLGQVLEAGLDYHQALWVVLTVVGVLVLAALLGLYVYRTSGERRAGGEGGEGARAVVRDVGADDPLLVAAYRELLEVSFAPDELDTLERMRESMAEGRLVVAAVADGQGRPLAVACGEWSAHARTLLLAYLAVREDQRSRGLGGRLLVEACRAWQERFRPALTLAEVAHPRAHHGSRGTGRAVARLRFYARHGARALDLPYFQPSLGPGRARVYGMLLLVLGVGSGFGSLEEVRAVPAEPVRVFLTDYLLETEGRVGTDRATRDLQAAVARQDGIPLLPLLPLDRGEGLPRSVPPAASSRGVG